MRRRLLVEAGIRCLARGGIAAFTVDRIRKEAGVSRGLLNHYFARKDDLLVEIYKSSLYASIAQLMNETKASAVAEAPEARLVKIVEANFSSDYFSKSNLLVWLALWGEIAVNRRLKATHRKLYDAYRRSLTGAIAAIAGARRRDVNAPALARSFIALVDGLWLEWCLDPDVLSPADARAASYELLEAQLGPLKAS